ncbi:MAG: hypothetical protein AVO38_13395 [delta proteobacterium ML8_D]|nr:MAG: hypothetical protein AVO38_13395 [delta proteobacterium ML8_D]
MFRHIEIPIFFFVLIISATALAVENPDELYRLGRFAEAEKAYIQMDMDYPKDIRFRYNRACAAYQNADYKGASAAFSSVLRRAKDDETRFKTAYNLGNTAFKLGDFASAVGYYKQAISYNPENRDAAYNLELALMQLEKQKEKQTKDPEKQTGGGCSQPQDKDNSSKESEGEKDTDKASQDKTAEEQSAQGKDQQSQKEPSGSEEPAEEHNRPQAMSEKKDGAGDEKDGQAVSAIDRKKAESLLNNLKEDRSGFMRFQVPQDKRYGVHSGKDW